MKHMIFCGALLLAGCAPQTEWVNADVDSNKRESDKSTCYFEAEKATVALADNAWLRAVESRKIRDVCMTSRGYFKVPAI